MKIFYKNLRRGLVLGVVVASASLVAWFGYNQWKLPSFMTVVQSHTSIGVFKEVNNDGQLLVFGNHVDDKYPNLIDYSKRQDFTVVINPDTKFVKMVWYFPNSLESIIKNKIQFKPAEIKKEKMTGSIDELKTLRGTSVNIKTEGNTAKKTTFEAMEVEYVVYVYAK